jgi:uncharacterized SAM-binding protein YcdF (DUF218 family)
VGEDLKRFRFRLRARHLVFFLVGCFLFDLGFFAAKLLPAPQDPARVGNVDLIAVLTGGQRRLKEAMAFLLQGRGKYLFISGVARGSDVNEIFLANKVEVPPEALRNHIYLGEEAESTAENALEVRRISEQLEVSSVLLVTSNYHLQRARWLIEKEFEHSPATQKVQIFTYPVESPNFDRQSWYRSPTAWSILIWEYLKSMPVRLGF